MAQSCPKASRMASFIHSFIKKLLTSETDADGDAGEQEVELVAPPAAILLLLVGGFEDIDDVGRLDERRRVDDVTRRKQTTNIRVLSKPLGRRDLKD